MTTSKLNKEIIKFVIRELARVNYDTNRLGSYLPLPGIYFNLEDSMAAEAAPRAIINILQIRYKKGDHFTVDEIKRFVEKQAWCRSFQQARAMLQLDKITGKNQKRHIQEMREAIDVLEKMGELEAEWYKSALKKVIDEM